SRMLSRSLLDALPIYVLDPVAREVVGYQAGQLVEPEVGDGGEDLALLRNGFGQDHVERGQAIGRDHQHAFVVDFVEVADLARVDFLQAESVAGAHVRFPLLSTIKTGSMVAHQKRIRRNHWFRLMSG